MQFTLGTCPIRSCRWNAFSLNVDFGTTWVWGVVMKKFLLASAAAIAAVSSGQAADLPVKAKAVEYVKICSLYGAGFWYVPGTDTCLKIGSYVRVQTAWDAEGGGIPIGFGTGGGQFTRSDTNEFNYRTRAALSVDLRTQTEYGTLRSEERRVGTERS